MMHLWELERCTVAKDHNGRELIVSERGNKRRILCLHRGKHYLDIQNARDAN
jgi:hypothetical protein